MPIMDDRFQNIMGVEVSQSTINTIVFQEIRTGVSLGQGLGLVIDEIRYQPTSGALRELDGSTDELIMGLTTTDSITDMTDFGDSRILDSLMIYSDIVGAVVDTKMFYMPVKHEFSPPMIMAAPTLFFGMSTGGFAAVATCRVRISFRYIKLTAQEYLEVAETFLNL